MSGKFYGFGLKSNHLLPMPTGGKIISFHAGLVYAKGVKHPLKSVKSLIG